MLYQTFFPMKEIKTSGLDQILTYFFQKSSNLNKIFHKFKINLWINIFIHETFCPIKKIGIFFYKIGQNFGQFFIIRIKNYPKNLEYPEKEFFLLLSNFWLIFFSRPHQRIPKTAAT